MKRTFFLLSIFFLSIACGNSEKYKDKKASSKATGSPCELLSETEIKQILSIPEDATTSMSEKDKTFPACFYKWKSITFPAKGFGDRTIDYPAEISIVWVHDASKEKYDTAIKFYKDGETQNGVGDRATWGEKKSQLTFLSKGNLIHVHVKVTGDVASNKAKAIKIASLITEKL